MKQLPSTNPPLSQIDSPNLTVDRTAPVPDIHEERRRASLTAPAERGASLVDEAEKQTLQSKLTLEFRSIELPDGLRLPDRMAVEENAEQFRYRFAPEQQWEVLYKKGFEPPPGPDGSRTIPVHSISAGPNSDPNKDGVVDRLRVVSRGSSSSEEHREAYTLVLNPEVSSELQKRDITREGLRPLIPRLSGEHNWQELKDNPTYIPNREITKAGVRLADPATEIGVVDLGEVTSGWGKQNTVVEVTGTDPEEPTLTRRYYFPKDEYKVVFPEKLDAMGMENLIR